MFFDHAHNDFVKIVTHIGLLVALSLWTALRVMATRKQVPPWSIAFGVAMSVVALLGHSAVDFNLQIPDNAKIKLVVLAMGLLSYTLPSKASA
jgi:hypothetical protein